MPPAARRRLGGAMPVLAPALIACLSPLLFDARAAPCDEARVVRASGESMVLDEMARRWRNEIDVFMGDDVEAAREWGVREVRIRWRDPRS